jgi:NAD(P)-dependent dehydrogenase (short-subunit alcohol dehydrogenase family)
MLSDCCAVRCFCNGASWDIDGADIDRPDQLCEATMQGKTIVITGGTSGIGEVAALQLAAMGARIVLVARSKARGEATLAQLEKVAPGLSHKSHYANLSLLAEMKRVATEIAASEPRIDVLINNAGALFNSRRLTADGLEYTFATNHMAYFIMTAVLRDKLTASAPARIVNTASDAHKGGSLDLDDLQSAKSFLGFRVYGTSKLCNILFTRALARRLQGTGVTANCLHPGFVATRFGDESGGFVGAAAGVAKRLFAITPEEGAKTIVYLASSPTPAVTSGEYFVKSKPAVPTRTARNDALAEELWAKTAALAGVDWR